MINLEEVIEKLCQIVLNGKAKEYGIRVDLAKLIELYMQNNKNYNEKLDKLFKELEKMN
ncbi:MAG: hypothetical protein KatS3mg003_1065 [Candidatus Nitrosocaldaceae archaeon]|nr:MAG: hypothetical protein KatS3mg003_1065 [Candidatus Nitrosocaldaceae archaeon]